MVGVQLPVDEPGEAQGEHILPGVQRHPLPEGDNGMYDFADLDKDVQLKKAVEVMKEKLGK